MFDYKKIFASQKLRFRILKMLSFVPDRIMLSWQYRIKLGAKPDFRSPQRFTEKLLLYKMHYRNPVLHQCVDKYEVRKYVESMGLNDILVPLYGVWNDCRDIDFDSLPERFVIKTTDGGGGENIVLCHDKSSLDHEALCSRLLGWKNKKSVDPGREWAYTGISESRYVVEEMLVDEECPEAGIKDYKFLCFGGKPKVVVYDTDRYVGHKRNFYDLEWNDLHVSSDCPPCDRVIDRPDGLDEMVRVAEKLAAGFPFVRVDLYYVSGRVWFGELTFYPWSGYVRFDPDSFDYQLGSWFDVSSFYKVKSR